MVCFEGEAQNLRVLEFQIVQTGSGEYLCLGVFK